MKKELKLFIYIKSTIRRFYGKIRSLFWSIINSFVRLDIRYITSCHISFFLPLSINIPHPIGIVIGRDIKFGKNITIMQNVTIGVKTLSGSDGPSFGDNCIIGAGAVVVGAVDIPSGSIIKANSLVVGKNARTS